MRWSSVVTAETDPDLLTKAWSAYVGRWVSTASSIAYGTSMQARCYERVFYEGRVAVRTRELLGLQFSQVHGCFC